MHAGWVKLYRKVGKGWLVRDDHDALAVFVYLLTMATHVSQKVMVNGRLVGLKPGEVVGGRKRIAEACGLSQKQVRRIIKLLEETGTITCRRATEWANAPMVISLINWEVYQGCNDEGANERAKQGPTKGPNKGQRKGPQKGQRAKGNSSCEFEDLAEQTMTNGPTEGPTDAQEMGQRKGHLYKEVKNKEKKYVGTEQSCSAPESAKAAPQASPPDTVFSLPTNKGELYPITEQHIDEWSETYPAVDVMAELRRMKAWLDANPRRRKTRRGMMAFIINWLSKEQDKGGRNKAPQHEEEVPHYHMPAKADPPPERDPDFVPPTVEELFGKKKSGGVH